MEVPLDRLVSVLFPPVAELELVVGAGVSLAIGIAKGKVEDALVVVIDQREDLVRLDHAHFGAGFIGLNGFGTC